MSIERPIAWLKGDYVGKHERQAQATAANCKVAIEFHFNSNGKKATGGETWYKPGDVFSKNLAADILTRYGNVGLSPHGSGLNAATTDTRAGWLPFYQCDAVLLEPLFVSNLQQAQWIHDAANVDALAAEIVAAIGTATSAQDIIGLSIGHRFKHSNPTDQGSSCVIGDWEADHGQALAQSVAALLAPSS